MNIYNESIWKSKIRKLLNVFFNNSKTNDTQLIKFWGYKVTFQYKHNMKKIINLNNKLPKKVASSDSSKNTFQI